MIVVRSDVVGPPRPSRLLGLDLDAVQVNSVKLEKLASESGYRESLGRTSEIPPSVLIPIGAKEPPRLDAQWPAHPRGSGQIWPKEARFTLKGGAGRLPVALAWEFIRTNRRWEWSFEGSHLTCPSEAVGAAAAEACDVGCGDSAVLVIPNFCDLATQQTLLESASRRNYSLRLLWRPVAGALAWSKHVVEQGDKAVPDEVLLIYFGVDHFEVTPLKIVRDRATGVLQPARERPQASHTCVSPALGGLLNVAAAGLREEPTDENLWRLLWTTSFCGDFLAALRQDSETRHKGRSWRSFVEVIEADAARYWNKGLAGEICAAAKPLFDFVCSNSAERGVSAWFEQVLSFVADRRVRNVVAFGPLAAAVDATGLRHADIVRKALPADGRVCIEGLDFPRAAAARGAAEYARRLALDLPTYLDKLPRLRLQVMRGGEPHWLNLLETDNWVSGGRPWNKSDYEFELAVSVGDDHVEFAVDHEEHAYVRLLKAQLPKRTMRKEPFTLETTIEPAQGNARIVVVPRDRDAFGRNTVRVDWGSMKEAIDQAANRKLTADDYLKTLPKAFPDWNPRLCSAIKWQPVASLLERYVDGGQQVNLATIIPQLQSLDRARDHEGIEMRAVSSDATVISRQSLLDGAIEKLADLLPRQNTGTNGFKLRFKALTYMSARHPKVIAIIRDTLQKQRERADIFVLIASGCCLNEPGDVAAFVKVLCERLASRPNGMYWWFRSLADMVRYRIDALAEVDPLVCDQLARAALAVFESAQTNGRPTKKSMVMAMVIVYLLRTRRYDSNFMDPEGSTAVRIKEAFKGAQRSLNRAGLFLGAKEKRFEFLLKLMIDYIDRQGRGPIYVED